MKGWVRKYSLYFLLAGGILGAGGAAGATWLYLSKNPKTVEWLIVNKVVATFSGALDFDARKQIYMALPDASFPIPSHPHDILNRIIEMQSAASARSPTGLIGAWAHLANSAFKEVLCDASRLFPFTANVQ